MTKKQITAMLETITPAIAKDYLETMIGNRSMNQNNFVNYLRDIKGGNWCENGETIKFTSEGNLFDGQTRLRACIAANRPFVALVVRGVVDPDAMSTTDIGAPKSPAHILQTHHIPEANAMAAAGRVLYWYDHKMLHFPNVIYTHSPEFRKILSTLPTGAKGVRLTVPDKRELLDYVTQRQDIILSSLHQIRRSKVGNLLPFSDATACHAIFSTRSRSDADVFFDDLGAGADLRKGDPVLILREKLIVRNSAQSKIMKMALLLYTFKAWNKRRAGEKSQILRLNPEGEDFPKVL